MRINLMPLLSLHKRGDVKHLFLKKKKKKKKYIREEEITIDNNIHSQNTLPKFVKWSDI